MNKQLILKQTENYIKQQLQHDVSGHDWWHVYRVRECAKYIAAAEKADIFVVELAALLHDIADWKFHKGDLTVGPNEAHKWLQQLEVPSNIIDKVCHIIKEVSYKGAGVKESMTSIESMVVQDADRLDALGAIGIARTFAYGGFAGRSMYDPNLKPTLHQDQKDYANNKSPSINHFYEKLLLLKDRMKTKTGYHLAMQRHQFLQQYLEQFFLEWRGEYTNVT